MKIQASVLMTALVLCCQSGPNGPAQRETTKAAESTSVTNPTETKAVDAEGLFSSCSGTNLGVGTVLKCDEFFAFVANTKAQFDDDALLEASFNGLKMGFTRGPISGTRTVMKVTGEDRAALLYGRSTDAHGSSSALQGIFVVGSKTPGAPPAVSCGQKGSYGEQPTTLCRAVIEVLSAGGIPKSVRVEISSHEKLDDNKLELVGRKLQVPEDCSMKGADRIRCRAAEFHWRHLSSDVPLGFDAIYGPLRTAFSKLGSLNEEDVGCSIDGYKAECRYLSMTKPSGITLNVLVAMAVVRNKRVIVQCNSTQPLKTMIPEPCGQVLSIESK